MAASLQRLLILRQRLKQAAEMALQASMAALRREQDSLACNVGEVGGAALHATEMLGQQSVRDNAWIRVQRQHTVIVAAQQALQVAKREHRQVELLCEKRADELQKKRARREQNEQEDWGRSQRTLQKDYL